jgi:hypothetical protein
MVVRAAAACPRRAHRLEWLEPYEGKLSRTVLRGVRAGNRPRLPGDYGEATERGGLVSPTTCLLPTTELSGPDLLAERPDSFQTSILRNNPILLLLI